MESNKIKLLWQTQNEQAVKIFIDKDYVTELESNINRVKKKLTVKLVTETIIALLIFAGSSFILYHRRSDIPAFNFGLKIIVLTALCFIPVTINFYNAVFKLNSIDYEKPINQFLIGRVKNIKNVIKKLWIIGLLTCVIILIVLVNDKYFASLSSYLKMIIFVFVFFIAFFSWTILKRKYGDELGLLENKLNDFNKEVHFS